MCVFGYISYIEIISHKRIYMELDLYFDGNYIEMN